MKGSCLQAGEFGRVTLAPPALEDYVGEIVYMTHTPYYESLDGKSDQSKLLLLMESNLFVRQEHQDGWEVEKIDNPFKKSGEWN